MMMKPILMVLSRDMLLTRQIPGMFEGRLDVRACETPQDLEDATRELVPQALIADFRRAGTGGHEEDRFLDGMKQRFPDLQIVMLTTDDCPEPLERRAVISDILHLRGKIDAQAVLARLRSLLPEPQVASRPAPSALVVREPATSGPIVGGIAGRFETTSPALQKMLGELEVAAAHDVTILLIGETGSGKTFLSRLIHDVSPRSADPFLHLACGALPSDLIESELLAT